MSIHYGQFMTLMSYIFVSFSPVGSGQTVYIGILTEKGYRAAMKGFKQRRNHSNTGQINHKLFSAVCPAPGLLKAPY